MSDLCIHMYIYHLLEQINISKSLLRTRHYSPYCVDKDEKDKKTKKYVRRERYAGSMSRSFYVGEDIRQEDIHAKYESGVLKLSIPKAEEKKPEVEEHKYIAIEG